MTEGNGPVKTKRMGARFFKNPPQPHMCIRDSLKGSPDPCYINVLSWDKVALGMSSEYVPLYGGMKVWPPRTEKKDVAIFAVMANPEILKLHGKNARNPKERSWLIEILMDFVEKMNEGVTFNRRYTVLRDRDITGELKEIWMVVQSERAKAQQMAGAEELRRPVPQYPYYQEQQHPQQHQPQQHQQLQQLQQHQQHQQHPQQHSMPQHHQHPSQLHQQQPPQHPHDDHPQQPPQYHSPLYYPQETIENCESYDPNSPRQNVIITNDERKYLRYDDNSSRLNRHYFREPIVVQNFPVNQQNCMNYANYQYQQLSRPIGPPFPPNVHPNSGLNCQPSSMNVHHANPMNHPGSENSMRYNKSPMENFYENYHRMPQSPTMQPQLSQMQMLPTCYYEASNVGTGNFLQILRPQENRDVPTRRLNHLSRGKTNFTNDRRDVVHSTAPTPPPLPPPLPETTTNVVEFSDNVFEGRKISGIQRTSMEIVPTCYYESTNVQTGQFLQILRTQENRDVQRNLICGKKMPIHGSMDQRENDCLTSPPTPPPLPKSTENVENSSDKQISSSKLSNFPIVGANISNTVVKTTNDDVTTNVSTIKDTKKGSTINFLKLFRPQDVDTSRKDRNSTVETNNLRVVDSQDLRTDETSTSKNFSQSTTCEENSKKSSKPKIKVLKRNKSLVDQKSLLREAKFLLNGDAERLRDGKFKDVGILGKDCEIAERIDDGETNGIVDKQRTDLTRIGKTTTTIRNTLKILGGSVNVDDTGNKKKTNGQTKLTSGKDNVDEVSQVYTILRKPEATTSREDETGDLSKLSLKDCGDNASEVGTVIS